MHETRTAPGLTRSLAIILVVRTALNTGFRLVYPFLPSLRSGLDISVASAGSLATLRMVAGLAAPLLGPWADRHSRRTVMALAMGIMAVACALLAGPGTLAAAAAAFVLYGLAKVLYDPSMHAYLGDSVPYARRGRFMGIAELTWSAAWLLGVPAAGFLIAARGWQAPWAVLSVLGAAGATVTLLGLPGNRPKAAPADTRRMTTATWGTWRALLRRPRVRALLLASLLLVAANEVMFIVYGAWLHDAYGLSLSAIGLASIVVGLAEAAGELGTATLTDRLGKRRAVTLGLLGLAASLAVLPLLAGRGLAGALAGVVAMMLTFEFSIVSLLPLASEVAPEARASYLSLTVTAFSLGRIAAAAAGGWLWALSGCIAANAAAGAACALLAALVMARKLGELE